MRQGWTKEEDDRLIAIANDESSKLSVAEIAGTFGRSKASVKHRAIRLGCCKLGRQRVCKISDEAKQRMRELNDQGIDCKKIAAELGLSHGSVVTYVRLHGGNSSKWTEEEVQWLRDNYPKQGGRFCADHFGVDIKLVQGFAAKYGIKREHDPNAPIPNLARRRTFDEVAICNAYKTAKGLKEVAVQFDTDYNQISKILKKHGIEIELYSRFREHQDGIIADYQRGDMPTQEIGKKYGISDDRIREGLRELGLFDETRYGRFANKRNYYDCWVIKYGREEADRRLVEYRTRLKANARRGKDSASFGKPSPQGAGNGWKGWYRGHYFRSLREVMFMIGLDKRGIEWKSAETKALTIPYEWQGGPRTYRADFLVKNELWELKPKKLHQSPNVTAKRVAAERFCAERGLVYRLEDVEIDKGVIHEAYTAGLVKFDRDYEKRFLEYAA